MPKPNDKWLQNAKAAELLDVNERTIKRWMAGTETRTALLAVRHGKQWRIPLPDNEVGWRVQTRQRLETAGILLKPSWKRALEKVARRCDRYMFESYRLWVAAYAKALSRGRMTQKARNGILLLWQQACKILDPLPRHEMRADRLKSKFVSWARAWALENKAELSNPKSEWPRHFMRYWPGEEHFAQVRAARTFDALEEIRHRLDLLQATRDLKRRGKKPTAENLRPLLHDDMMAHINDTREKLPGRVFTPKTPEELRRIAEASIYLTNEQRAGMTIDLRGPQDGLALRTFRARHPLKKSPQQEIVATVYEVRDSILGAEEKPRNYKTPVRDSEYPKGTQAG